MTGSNFATRGIRGFGLAAIMATFGTGASSETIDWKTVGGWDISFYTNSKGCQAFAVFEQSTAFFIGFDSQNDNLRLDVTILDKRWGSINDGQDYSIKLTFGDESPWTLGMTGTVVDEYSGLNLMISADTDEAELFIDEFQRENSMNWNYSGNQLGHYTLRGSRLAFNEVISCQRSYLEAASQNNDPFATDNSTNSSGKSDPFAD